MTGHVLESVRNALQTHTMTRRELSATLGVCESSVCFALRRLKERGEVHCVGSRQPARNRRALRVFTASGTGVVA